MGRKKDIKIILDTYGNYLGMEKGCIVLRDKERNETRYPLIENTVSEIVLNSGNMVSTGLLCSMGFWGTDVLISTRNGKPIAMLKSLDDDCHVETRISRARAVDLETLDEVTRWGFNRDFPLRDTSLVLKTTQESFRYLDNGDLKKATETLLKINGVGISRASKIIGLFDQENLCVYDSRVGKALNDLIHNDDKIIFTPPGYGREYDNISNPLVWADYYQKLIWTIEIIRDYMNEKGCTYRSADIEMALFMMGK